MELLQKKAVIQQKYINEESLWDYVFIVKKDIKDIKVRIKNHIDGYKIKYQKKCKGIILTHRPKQQIVKGKIYWVMKKQQIPKEITIELNSNGRRTNATRKITARTGWKYNFGKMPMNENTNEQNNQSSTSLNFTIIPIDEPKGFTYTNNGGMNLYEGKS